MTQIKAPKLSANMKEVVRKMQSGLSLGWFGGVGSLRDHIKLETDIKNLSPHTFRGLINRSIIKETDRKGKDKFYSLTELGKSISL